MAIAELSVIPLGTDSTSLSDYVAQCHKVLKEEPGITYSLTAMGTIVEGDLETIFAVAKKLHEVPFKKGAMRVVTQVKIDDRRDKEASIEQKLSSVQEKLEE